MKKEKLMINVPFTTVVAGSMAGPKIPEGIGDSGQPVAAGLLSAMPLAVVSAALVGAWLVGGASGMPARHAAVLPAQHGVTVAAGALATPKYPDDGGD